MNLILDLNRLCLDAGFACGYCDQHHPCTRRDSPDDHCGGSSCLQHLAGCERERPGREYRPARSLSLAS